MKEHHVKQMVEVCTGFSVESQGVSLQNQFSVAKEVIVHMSFSDSFGSRLDLKLAYAHTIYFIILEVG